MDDNWLLGSRCGDNQEQCFSFSFASRVFSYQIPGMVFLAGTGTISVNAFLRFNFWTNEYDNKVRILMLGVWLVVSVKESDDDDDRQCNSNTQTNG